MPMTYKQRAHLLSAMKEAGYYVKGGYFHEVYKTLVKLHKSDKEELFGQSIMVNAFWITDNCPTAIPAGWNYEKSYILAPNHPPLPDDVEEMEDVHFAAGYQHPLPKNLLRVGNIWGLFRHNHPLPSGLKEIGCVNLAGYKYELPNGVTKLGCVTGLARSYGYETPPYEFPLPPSLRRASQLWLSGYPFPLPPKLKTVDCLSVKNYGFALPDSLRVIGNFNGAEHYNHLLPPNLKKIRLAWNFSKYCEEYELPKDLQVLKRRNSWD